MKTIYIIRHGQTDFNRKHIVQGSGVDSDLNDWGQRQGRLFFEAYQNIDFEVIITSKLKRTEQTVLGFIDKKIPHESFAEINEISWGIHEGKTGGQEMRDEYLKIIGEWKAGNFDARFEAGESAQELKDRIEIFVEMLKKRPEKTILVCSHGRAMRCLICVMKGISITEMDSVNHHNTGLYLAKQMEDEFIFEKEDDTEHLASLKAEKTA